ncbi:hypothetical protein PR048_001763 [Dryococelus australis]|uniref:C2H2-type domain-containing protein n=1 Tax=Dryococelus australis TaxID=614101 RepID=A0ABQ9II71_9NEOP|nr:hypothetical protein PR048_001763 [Dryococelus australis]
MSVGNGNTENNPFHLKTENELAPVKHEMSNTSINECGMSLKSPLVESGSSKNDSSRENAESCTSTSVKNEVPIGTVVESDGEGGGDPKLNAVKLEDADVKIPSNILVTKIPGSCSIYTCQICDRCFVSEEAARKHTCNNSMEMWPPSMQMQSGQADAREYTCEHCNKTFTRYVSLLAHQESHLRCFSEEELDEDLGGEAAQPDDASAKKQRKRPLSTSSEEGPVPSNP